MYRQLTRVATEQSKGALDNNRFISSISSVDPNLFKLINPLGHTLSCTEDLKRPQQTSIPKAAEASK
jgi:hypothetical protein